MIFPVAADGWSDGSSKQITVQSSEWYYKGILFGLVNEVEVSVKVGRQASDEGLVGRF